MKLKRFQFSFKNGMDTGKLNQIRKRLTDLTTREFNKTSRQDVSDLLDEVDRLKECLIILAALSDHDVLTCDPEKVCYTCIAHRALKPELGSAASFLMELRH